MAMMPMKSIYLVSSCFIQTFTMFRYQMHYILSIFSITYKQLPIFDTDLSVTDTQKNKLMCTCVMDDPCNNDVDASLTPTIIYLFWISHSWLLYGLHSAHTMYTQIEIVQQTALEKLLSSSASFAHTKTSPVM